MRIHKIQKNNTTYIQIYITQEESLTAQNQQIINSLKNKNTQLALFISGNTNYPKILQTIITSQLEKSIEL